MPDKVGPLLRTAISKLQDRSRTGPQRLAAATHLGLSDADDRLPVVVNLNVPGPQKGETWREYKARISGTLVKFGESVDSTLGAKTEPLYLANAVRSAIRPDQAAPLADQDVVTALELDPMVQVVNMDDAIDDIGLAEFHLNHPDTAGNPLTGDGVRVAVLDSGIDAQHPNLTVADSVSTSGESYDIPGSHGTHCAGSIASTDAAFPGVAPGVSLINVKVLQHDGRGSSTNITQGVDEALDRDADILSMSLGFNHLPTWSNGGHGWFCQNGRCPLCTAVDNAVALGAVVIVAAGNEHSRAENLRNFGFAKTFDTELGCPGQARDAITVAALTKTTFLPASFSSRGPTAYDDEKPDIAAPGVNITSTVPVPRDSLGNPIANPPRSDLFGRKSGTSMATPIVAGAASLLIQLCNDQGTQWTPASIRSDLLQSSVTPLLSPTNVVGAGRLNLDAF